MASCSPWSPPDPRGAEKEGHVPPGACGTQGGCGQGNDAAWRTWRVRGGGVREGQNKGWRLPWPWRGATSQAVAVGGKERRQLVEMWGLGLRMDCVLEPPDSSESVGPGGCLGIGSPRVI